MERKIIKNNEKKDRKILDWDEKEKMFKYEILKNKNKKKKKKN
jgi:hypothetical protein